MIQEKSIKKKVPIKQLKRAIEYLGSHERTSCSNCINLIQDITANRRKDWYKCSKYNIGSISSFSICKSFKPNL
jgi:hypothetical protein